MTKKAKSKPSKKPEKPANKPEAASPVTGTAKAPHAPQDGVEQTARLTKVPRGTVASPVNGSTGPLPN